MLHSLLSHSFTEDEVPDPSLVFARLPVLETERLILRPLRMRDAKDLYDYGRDPAVSRYCLWEPYESLRDARAYVRCVKQRARCGDPTGYGAVLKATGHVVGTVGFVSWLPEHACCEIGYSFARAVWGQGLATEALGALLGLCFDIMKLNRVEAFSAAANTASARVMEKCGMRREGTLRRRVCLHGRFTDVDLHAILREDYEASSSL